MGNRTVFWVVIVLALMATLAGLDTTHTALEWRTGSQKAGGQQPALLP